MDDAPVEISVIIPFYHNIKWLEEAVQSVLAQTFHRYEIIVINDGSLEDDNLFKDKYKYKIRYVKVTNGGPGRARNIGIRESNGNYIAFLDSDDLWHPEKLQTQYTEMVANGWVWSHSGFSIFHDGRKTSDREVDVAYFKGDVFFMSLISSPIATPCVMIKRKFLEEYPEIRFAENMKVGQDSYFWINIANLEKLGVVARTLSSIRIRGTNAALQARAQIRAKGDLYRYLKQYRDSGIRRFTEISFGVMFVYIWCHKADRLIRLIEKKIRNKIFVEQISRILYFFPYIYTRILKKYLKSYHAD